LCPAGLLSSEAFDLLAFRIQSHRKQRTSNWCACNFIADRSVRPVTAKVGALMHRTSQQDLDYMLSSINSDLNGRVSNFRNATSQRVFAMVHDLTWQK